MRRKGHVLKQQREDELTPFSNDIGDRKTTGETMSSVFRQKVHHVFLQHARQPRAQLLPASHGLVRAPAVHSPIAQCLRNKKTCSDMHMSPHTHIYMEDAWQTSSHIELTLQRGPHYNITSNKKTSSHIESTFQPKDNNSNNNNKNSNSNIELKNKTSSL